MSLPLNHPKYDPKDYGIQTRSGIKNIARK